MTCPEQISDGDSQHAGTPWQRRAFLAAGGAAAAALVGLPLVRRFTREAAGVFLARNQSYDGDLAQTIRDGLVATGIDPAWLAGRHVLLKPNLVEPTRDAPHISTHPAVVLAAAAVLRDWGALVSVGEGPGHLRDTELALMESGVGQAIEEAGVDFIDLNYSLAQATPNLGGSSALKQFYFPRQVLAADLIVSLPKLKTHHWVGITASMKNLYGTLPGAVYGWPKNVLHHAGIPQTVVDINASLPKTIAIVDAIECMEGDGPIMGTPKRLGMLAIGANPTAVDATCARIMGLDPQRVSYLELAAGRLGPIDHRDISQRGESWEELRSPFQILDVPYLQSLRAV